MTAAPSDVDAPRPAPLTPADCDLTAFDWFPLKHKRLTRSAWWLRASDRAKALNIDLWCAAYEEVPAASLPDDDVALSEIAGFGRRDLTAWLAIKEEVLAPWTLCSDGRWYHETLAEVANEAWASRQAALKAREAERERKRAATASAGKSKVSGGKERVSGGKPEISGDLPADFQRTSGGIPPENALKGQDRREEEEADASPSDARAASMEGGGVSFETFRDQFGVSVIRGRGSPPKARTAFNALSPGDRHAVLAAAKRYGEAAPWGSNGPVGIDRFLTDEVWRDFVVTASVTDIVWRGPPALRAAVVAEMGEPFARSYLDPAEWRPGSDRGAVPVLAALTPGAAQRLKSLKALSQIAIQSPLPPRKTA